MNSKSRLRITLCIALIGHIVLFALTQRDPRSLLVEIAEPNRDVTVELDPSLFDPPTPFSDITETEPTRQSPAASVSPARSKSEPISPSQNDLADKNKSEPLGDSHDPISGFQPLSLDQLGLSGKNAFGPIGSADAGTTQSLNEQLSARLNEQLRAPMRERDRELGLGPEGPVIRVLEENTFQGTADVNGKAIFEAVFDANGALTALSVIDSNGPRNCWEAIANSTLQSVGGKPFRSIGGKGLVSRIEVESRWQLPSGHDPGVNVDVLHLPVHKGQGKKSATVSLIDPIPQLSCDLIGGVRVCVPMINFKVFSTNIDPTDLTANPTHTIRAHVVSESPI